MIAVCGFDDREMINRALLYRYIISYEPFNFKGDLSDFPLTLKYGKKVDALRRRYSSYLWRGIYRHHQGIRLTEPVPESIEYAIFVEAETGKRAVVLISDEISSDLTVSVEFDSKPAELVSVSPTQPEARPCDPLEVLVVARSATVLLER